MDVEFWSSDLNFGNKYFELMVFFLFFEIKIHWKIQCNNEIENWIKLYTKIKDVQTFWLWIHNYVIVL
jgi:hypothetical protein